MKNQYDKDSLKINLSYKKRSELNSLDCLKRELKLSKKPSSKRITQNDNDSCDHKKKKSEPTPEEVIAASLQSEDGEINSISNNNKLEKELQNGVQTSFSSP